MSDDVMNEAAAQRDDMVDGLNKKLKALSQYVSGLADAITRDEALSGLSEESSTQKDCDARIAKLKQL
eukprot:1827600-Lingulodinium_polyedra.AAC.1